MKRFALLILYILLLSSSACAITIKPALEGPPVVEPLELTMGKCFSPAISNYEYRDADEDKMLYVFPLGSPSVAMFGHVFTGMFVKTVPVEHCPPATDQGLDVDAVIDTQIERFWWYWTPATPGIDPTGPGTPRDFSVEITYRFILYSPEGETIDSWTVVGSGLYIWEYIPGTSKLIVFLPESKWLSAAVKLAMRDAAADFITEFRDQPKIREWIQKRDVSSGERQ